MHVCNLLFVMMVWRSVIHAKKAAQAIACKDLIESLQAWEFW